MDKYGGGRLARQKNINRKVNKKRFLEVMITNIAHIQLIKKEL